jgi:tetratricopeptide (TPR) repeat protein
MKPKTLRKPYKKLAREDTIKSIDEEIVRLKSNATVENATSFLRQLTEVRNKANAVKYREGIVETYLASAVINSTVHGVSSVVMKDYTTALKLAEQCSYRKGKAYAKMGLIRAHDMKGGDSNESIYAASEVLSLARKDNDEYLEWRALKLLSNIFSKLGEISRGYRLFEEALVIAEKRGVVKDIVRTITDAPSTVLAPALYEKHLRKAVELTAFEEIGIATKSFTFLRYAGVLFQLKRYDECDAYMDRVVELLPRLPSVNEGEVRASIGSYYLERGLENEARKEFQHALELGTTPRAALYINAEMGRLHAKSDPQKALHYFEEGLRFANIDNDLGEANVIHGYLADFYSSIGELEKASQQYGLYKSITEENKKREEGQRIEYAEMILRFDQSQKHEKQLTEEVEAKSAALASKAMLLAEQTELMANFRDDLRAILKRVEVQDPAINEIRRKLRELPEAVNWKEFDTQFQSVHPQFATLLEEKYPGMTKMELKLCVLLRLNLNSRDVSKLLSLSKRTIEKHRSNIRKKLAITSDEDIARFLGQI